MFARRHAAAVASAALAVAALLTAPAASADAVTDLYVSARGQDSNDCLTLDTACATITHAISLADPSGTTIHVDAGTFDDNVFPDGKTITVVGAGASASGTVLSSPTSGLGAYLASGDTLTLDSVEITGVPSGAIVAGGTLTATHTRFEQVPCALSVTGGTVTLTDSTIDEGGATSGDCPVGPSPAVAVDVSGGSASLLDSTIADFPGGTGVQATGGSVTVADSTFWHLGTALLGTPDSEPTVTRSTFVDAPVGDSVDLAGSLLAHDQQGAADCSGHPSSGGYNLSDDGSCQLGPLDDTSRDDVTDLHLDPAGPADHGGPTQTIALTAPSSAIDLIPAGPLCEASDQRGVPRTLAGQGCDAGAFELPTSSVAVTASRAVASPGQTVTFAATVTRETLGTVTDPDPLQGSVRFTQNDKLLCSRTLGTAGSASCATTKLAPGTAPVTATFGSTSAYHDAVGTTSVVVGTAPKFTSPQSGAATIGTPKTITVHAAGKPAPTITKIRGTLPRGMRFTTGDGTATIHGTPASGTAGQYVLTLRATNVRSTATQRYTLSIALASPTVALAVRPATPVAGKPARFTVTVRGAAATPTGTVRLTSRSRTVAGCATITLRRGAGTCTTTRLARGTRPVVARYSGDGAYFASTASRVITVVRG